MVSKSLYVFLASLLFSSALFGESEYFVSVRGSDSNPGTRMRPFATLQRGRDAIRELKKHPDSTKGPVTVWIEAGTYYLTKPLKLTNQDSGTESAPVIYRSQTGRQVRITGGQPVKGFEPVTDPKILNRLDASVRGKVLCVNLKSASIIDYGHINEREQQLKLFFNDKPMHIARWPNEGFVRIVETVGQKPRKFHNLSGTSDGKFTYSSDRPIRWKKEHDIWLHGYWFFDWSESFESVDSIDTDKRIITIKPPYHRYGYRKGQRYYVLNVLAELDRPGEWYLDRQKGILYFIPPSSVNKGRTVVSMVPHLFMLENCSWVKLQGLTLEATRSTTVTIEGGTGNTIADCTIRNSGNWAVNISGGENSSVVGCDIYHTGAGGISIAGGDRKTLTPAKHMVDNNHIYDFGRIYRTYTPAVLVKGVGNRISHNLIHNGPHNAIQLKGNEHIIEYNEIHHVCFETDDVGAFYMGRDWTERGTIIRYNYFHHIEGPDSLPYGVMAVYLDDEASGTYITGNIFYRAGKAVFIGGGSGNLIDNNIFVQCQQSIHVDARGLWLMESNVLEKRAQYKYLNAVPYKQPPWSKKYPNLASVLDDPRGAPRNIVRKNISLDGQWLDVRDRAKPFLIFENNLINKNPHFVDLKRENFRLRPDSPALLIGFQKIPVEKIGRRKKN